jgi:quinoprotein glucose dehydrogenase
MSRSVLCAALASCIAIMALLAVPSDGQPPRKKANGSDPGEAASRAVVEGGLKATVWAAEPLLENPVVFGFDHSGACYVIETNRFKAGVPDTRDHMYWLDDDIGARTVEDRVAMYNRQYPGKRTYTGYEKNSEIVRKVWDSTGSGLADKSSVFAEGFNAQADGVAAGVLARGKDVFFACIPSLYKLTDTKGEHKADAKTVLSTGYGIHVQFVGHDLHGLKIGPDGRLYFSVGDRGLNVVTKEGKKLFNPDSGAVLRCELDGSNLEMIHIGLRNPQELAFDDYGNLFTYDNNSDSGDQARWVQIIEGGDSGWRCGYQYGTLMHHPGVPQGNRGPWNTEKIWHVPGPNGAPPAYVVPPILHFGNGPSGLAYYPGVGLSDRYKGHFFACDFTSNPTNSLIWSLAVKPKGASFEVVDLHKFVRNIVPTDCDFGPDGGFYWSDWVGGWDLPKKGRLFRVEDPEAMKNPAVAEAKELLATGFAKRSVEELVKYLGHEHREVRQESQFELAKRGESVGNALLAVALGAGPSQPRLHAIRALGQITRQTQRKYGLQPLANDPDPTIRAVFAKVHGETGGDVKIYAKLFADTDFAVRRETAIAYGKNKPTGSDDFKPLFTFLKDNNNADAYLRHAAAQGLATMTEQPCDLVTAFDAAVEADKSINTPAVRLGVVLALRKLQCHRIARFLTDADADVAAEAARAIYDLEQMAAMPELAALAEKPGLPDAIAYRALAANYKLGEPAGAARLSGFAARSGEPEHLRVCALKLLADWETPSRRDAITGLTQTIAPRSAAPAADAVKRDIAKLIGSSDAIRSATIQAISKLKIKEVGQVLLTMVDDTARPASVRVESLFALDQLKAEELIAAAVSARKSTDAKLRAAGRVIAAKVDETAARTELPALLSDENASLIEKQMALGVLATMPPSKEVDEALAAWLDKLLAGSVAPEMKLDLLEAAETRVSSNRRLYAPLKDKLAAYDRQARDGVAKDPLSRSRDLTNGGDAEKGKEIFLNNAAVYCQRCHKLNGQGGEVGPDVTLIAKDKTRDYLLESIIDPNKAIAKGFESVILSLADGRTVSGVLRSKTDKEYTIVDTEGKVTKVPTDDVDREKPDKSAMPDDLHKKLSRRELRDVIEFLANLK